MAGLTSDPIPSNIDVATNGRRRKDRRRKKKRDPAREELRASLEPLALAFLDRVNSSAALRSRSSDRSEVQIIFEEWHRANPPPPSSSGGADGLGGDGSPRYLCAQVLALLRTMKLLRSKRTGDVVVCTFALSSTPNDYPPAEERRTAREEVLRRREALEQDKCGVTVVRTDDWAGSKALVPKGHSAELTFTVKNESAEGRKLKEIRVSGANRRCFVMNRRVAPRKISAGSEHKVGLVFRSPGTGVFRGIVVFDFAAASDHGPFQIARYVTIRSGDAVMHEILKPTSPYKKKRPVVKMGDPSEYVPAPDRPSGPPAFIEKLPQAKIPIEITSMIEQNELDGALEGMGCDHRTYATFWKRLLWASEAQAKLDIMLFDIKGALLVRQGRFFLLSVPGLAEGRPSVLRGDTIIVKLKGQGYMGRVEMTRLEEAVLDFDSTFSSRYRPGLDTVDVRFTFSRTTFRTSHAGSSAAVPSMGRHMLFPEPRDVEMMRANGPLRTVDHKVNFANRDLNPEQQEAVLNVLKGTVSPLPYIVFGPPGTGKTTTVVEAVYQIAFHPSRPRILVVAPSNDAADILVEKLSAHFPPSEMRRALAFSRTLEQISPPVKPYAKEGLSAEQQVREITSARVVVSTVNLAARFAFMGVKNSHFDVLCVDEAGHGTEPEVIAIASTLFTFSSNAGQIVLAGDPKQLGPIITSALCKKYGMDISYMERLSVRSVYGRGRDGRYPAHLLTKLVRNYRSHPAILKLPNELFYDNELQQCGSQFVTDSMARWEHLPKRGFPVVFHAVSGENLREGNSPSWFNPQEAQEVVNYVDLLVKQSNPSIDAQNIGVVTPYARQAQKIRLALKTRDLNDVKVGSVETFQGQERRVIIISTVRAENDYIDHDKKYNLGFVSNKKRFNVAVTRAQALLIVIGQPQVLGTDKETWLPLLKWCKDNQSWVGEAWEEDFDAFKEEDGLLGLAETKEQDDDDSVADGMDRLTISHAVEQEGLGYINREE